MRSPLTIFVPNAVQALLNSHHTEHFSVHCLTSYKFLLLTASHITLLCCYNFNLATFLPSVTSEVPYNCLMMTDHILILCNVLQEIPLGNTDFSWFTDVSYLKGDNGERCAEYAIAIPFDVVEAASLPIAILTQQTELYTLT